ncbi:MAG: type II secretion system protein GspG [Lacunisphaera sp.]|nr:type II secretion system protein GspG [Lacunisphaera sp.]
MKSASVRAFTLIEILVVVAIIGLLAGLLFTNTDKIFSQSQEVVARVFVRDSFKTALVRYKIDLGSYPTTAEGLGALLAAPANAADRWHGPYAEVTGSQIPPDPWGEPYQYRNPGTHNKDTYDLFSKGPDKTEGTADDIGNW